VFLTAEAGKVHWWVDPLQWPLHKFPSGRARRSPVTLQTFSMAVKGAAHWQKFRKRGL